MSVMRMLDEGLSTKDVVEEMELKRMRSMSDSEFKQLNRFILEMVDGFCSEFLKLFQIILRSY